MNRTLLAAEPPLLNCEQTVRRLWDYLDRQLSALDTEAVDQHLRDCKASCASHFAFERSFLQLVHAARPRNVATDTLRLRIAALVGSDDFTTTDEDA
jgi:anti-sigma factor RsiW